MSEIPGDEGWIWIERIFSRLPISHFFFSYLIFLLTLFIYIIIDMNTTSINLQRNYNQLIAVLITSFLIPFEVSGTILLMKEARKRFLYLDETFSRSHSTFHESLNMKMLDHGSNYLLIILFVGLPLASLSVLSWSGINFSDKIKKDPFYYGVDSLNYILLFISILLFCTILLLITNLYSSFHVSTNNLKSSISISNYNISILKRKLVPIKNYFLMTQLFLMICIAMLNISIFGIAFRLELSATFLFILFLFAIALTLVGLNDAQDIIETAIDKKMDKANSILEESLSNMNCLIDKGLKKGNKEVDALQEIIELQQKDLEKIFQERTGFNIKDSLKEAATFIASTVIPIISFILLDLLKPN